ncbi:TetR/AcrR family transcriptional regulator [Abyssisolibacter fermentans]|uniref:TetR/AcrR family transcriptional regulator n=1 Tax=Abyssisolibacter fermentans TaxID=1766203 RepID=UPI000832E1D9|nr:TetR/AcrR family transcriptional regulator [Abyssisolibacter fermentans]
MPRISEEKKQKRKEHIINTAFELFAEKGYSATGMRDIMKATNISKGGIYVYFKSKTAILLAIAERFDDKRHRLLNNIDLTLTADKIFTEYIKKRLEVFKYEENQKWTRIALEFWSLPKEIPELSNILNNRFNAYHSDIKFIIKQGINEGTFRSDCSVKHVIYQIMSTINGTGILSSSMGKAVTDKQIEETIKMYLKYLKG